jgi:hypothetical protein
LRRTGEREPFGKPRRRKENNIKIDLKDKGRKLWAGSLAKFL